MGRLILVRHARPVVDPNRGADEWELHPAGQDALERLAALPLFAGAQRIVSSTERKAIATAEAIRRHHTLPPLEQREALGELRKGSFVHGDHDAVMARLFEQPDQPVLEGWESGSDARQRFSTCLEQLAAETEDLIVVTHGTVLSLYLAALRGQERVDFAEWRSIGMPDVAVVDTGARKLVREFSGRKTNA